MFSSLSVNLVQHKTHVPLQHYKSCESSAGAHKRQQYFVICVDLEYVCGCACSTFQDCAQ